MLDNRVFTEEIIFRVTKEQKREILANAKAHDKTLSEFLRDSLRDYLALEQMERRKGAIQQYVAEAVEEKLKPVENRLAKITAKTAHASAISIFLQAQAMSDLGKSDVIHVFKVAREKGLAFVREKGIPNTQDIEEGIGDIERR